MFFDLFNRNNSGSNGLRPVMLLVLDGWGLAPPNKGNAISNARTPNMDSYYRTYPHCDLIASGESVGLPANEVGNTEVGHLTLGAGRTMNQDLKRINSAIADGSFFDNRAIAQAISYANQNGSKLHIMGLVGNGNVHSSLPHLKSIIQFCKSSDFSNFYIHAFTDGRDSPPNDAENVIKELEEMLRINRAGRIASVTGRYWAMDRDRRWERTERAYNALVLGQGRIVNSAFEAVTTSYAIGQTDEFIEPTVISEDGRPVATIDDNDAVIFFNFRIDRPRQLTMAFVLPDFETLRSYDFGHEPIEPNTAHKEGKVDFGSTFKRQKRLKNVFFVTMTEYQKGLPVGAIVYPPEVVAQPLAQVISEHSLLQIHLSESEKERFVTYYFDGLREGPFAGEEYKIVASPKVATYDKRPEMSVFGVTDEIKNALSKGKYSFLVANFANADMVAHSGSVPAAIVAIEALDRAIGMVVEAVLKHHGTVLITADHGNAESMLTYAETSFFFTTTTGDVNTDHTNNPVPFIAINKAWEGNPRVLPRGALYDVAPTILRLLELPIPPEMKGRNLLEASLQ